MKLRDFNELSIDELWDIRQRICHFLTKKLAAEKSKVELRLRRLNSDQRQGERERRRHYPQVLLKYRNPDAPSQTWTGRGKAPLWINKMLMAGKTLDDLRIRDAA